MAARNRVFALAVSLALAPACATKADSDAGPDATADASPSDIAPVDTSPADAPPADTSPPDTNSPDATPADTNPLDITQRDVSSDVVLYDCSVIGCAPGELTVRDATGAAVGTFSGTFTYGTSQFPFSCTPASAPVSDMTMFSCLGGGRLRLSYEATGATSLHVEAGAAGTFDGEVSTTGAPRYPNGPGCGPTCYPTLAVTLRP